MSAVIESRNITVQIIAVAKFGNAFGEGRVKPSQIPSHDCPTKSRVQVVKRPTYMAEYLGALTIC
jgi:hypothetical protein